MVASENKSKTDNNKTNDDNKPEPGPSRTAQQKEEAWGYDLYPERRGTFQPKISNILIGKEGKEGLEKIKCEKNVYECIKSSPIVKVMMAALKSSGCPIDIRRHISCEKCDYSVSGGYDPELNQIVVCQNVSTRKGMVQGVLAHEMIHMFDYCRNELDFKNMEHLACTEIRAANLTHCSFASAWSQGDASWTKIKQAHQDCVKTKALYSVLAVRQIGKAEAVDIIEKVFPKCYADLEPIGRRIRRNSDDMIRAFKEASYYGERIANIVNIVMTPCWGTIPAKTTEWITMTVYTLQEPATFTTTVACEILDLTERRRYQRNELLRRNKIEKCNQEFIITEKGFFHPNINDSPPYVLDLIKPRPSYIALTVSISSKGQRDGYPRMLLNKQWEQVPSYDLLSSDMTDYGGGGSEKVSSDNNMTILDIVRIIDGILWDALHSKMFKSQIEYCVSEEIPTYPQIVKRLESDTRQKLSRRVTSGICDAIVNKAVFHVFGLNTKHDNTILEAEEE